MYKFDNEIIQYDKDHLERGDRYEFTHKVVDLKCRDGVVHVLSSDEFEVFDYLENEVLLRLSIDSTLHTAVVLNCKASRFWGQSKVYERDHLKKLMYVKIRGSVKTFVSGLDFNKGKLIPLRKQENQTILISDRFLSIFGTSTFKKIKEVPTDFRIREQIYSCVIRGSLLLLAQNKTIEYFSLASQSFVHKVSIAQKIFGLASDLEGVQYAYATEKKVYLVDVSYMKTNKREIKDKHLQAMASRDFCCEDYVTKLEEVSSSDALADCIIRKRKQDYHSNQQERYCTKKIKTCPASIDCRKKSISPKVPRIVENRQTYSSRETSLYNSLLKVQVT